MKHKSTMMCLVFMALGTGVQAQESAVAAGGDASGTGGKVAYCPAQSAYTSQGASDGPVGNGVPEPIEISVVLDLEDNALELSLSTYPNPALGNLTLSISDASISGLSAQLCDVRGNLLDRRTVTDSKAHFNIQKLPAAVYFLKVIKDSEEVQTFKITKN